MTGIFQLDSDKVQRILRKHCTVDDCRAALGGYPGPQTEADVFLRDAAPAVLSACVQLTARDDRASSFLLRMIAGCWNRRAPRYDLLNLDSLVRPARVIDKPIGPLSQAFGNLSAAVPVPSGCQNLNCVYDGLSAEERGLLELLAGEAAGLEGLARGLREMAALKLLHDRLHAFQVMADQILEPADATADRLATLIDLVRPGLRKELGSLPPGGMQCRDRCDHLLTSAAELLKNGSADVDFIRVLLGQMLKAQMPQIDLLLFEAVCAWPLKKAVAVLDQADQRTEGRLDYDRAAVFDLHDALLRRLLAHRLWQDADLAVYDIEELLDEAPDNWLGQIYRRASELRAYLFALGAAPSPGEGLSAGFLSKLQSISFNDEDDADRRLPELREAFAEMRWRVRSNFLEVDGWLKQDFLRLDTLRASLDALLARIPKPMWGGTPWPTPN